MRALLITAGAGLLLSVGTYIIGRVEGHKLTEAQQLKEAALVQTAQDKMLAAAAQSISQIEIRHQTIRQEVQREVIEKPVFRDCRNTPESFRLLNDSLQNTSQPPNSGLLPSADAPSG